MRSFEVPALAEPPTTGGLGDMVATNAERDPANVAISVRDGDGWRDVTAADLHRTVVDLAKGPCRTRHSAG